MKPHKFYYRVFNAEGKEIFHSYSLRDAKLWLSAEGKMIRKDLLGNYPEKTYE